MSYLFSEDWRKMEKEIEQLKERNQQATAERIAAGLPDEPPPCFVPPAVIKYIYQNTDIKRLHKYVVGLARLALESNEVPPIKSSVILAMVPYYELLRWADDPRFNAVQLQATVGIFMRYDTYNTAERLARDLHNAAGFLRDKYGAYASFTDLCLCELEGRRRKGCICSGKEYYDAARIINEQVTQITDDYLAKLLAEARNKNEVVRQEREILEAYRNGGNNNEERKQ